MASRSRIALDLYLVIIVKYVKTTAGAAVLGRVILIAMIVGFSVV